MASPLVSIALCTYNGEKYLREQLDSLVKQDYSNLEIIAVDDRSTDATLEILNEYSVDNSNLKVFINDINLGYKKNFEKAIMLCNGEYIALSDQDDIWELDKISRLITEIKDSVLVYHDSLFIDHNGKSLNKRMSDVLNMYQGNSFKPFLFFNCVSGHACLFEKQLAEKATPFPVEIMHDQWLAFCAANLGSIKYLNEPLVKYRQHQSSDTNILKLDRKKVSKKLSGREKIIKSYEQLELFCNFPYNKNIIFIEKLQKAYYNRLTSYLAPQLVFIMYKNFNSLLYIYKKNITSKLNFIFRHIWGLKIKSA